MFGFHCDCSIDDGEPMWGWDEEWKIATSRPNVWCEECGRWIRPGEKYHEGSGILSYKLTHNRWEYELGEDVFPEDEEHREYISTCLGCKRIAERFCPGGYILGELSEQVAECIGFDYTVDPSELDDIEDWEEEVA